MRTGVAVEKTIPVQVRGVGLVEAFSTVSVKAQVDGVLMSVHFNDGQYVKMGDPLFTIDSRPFEANLKQAQANLARDKAQLDNAQRQLERNSAVIDKGYVSKEQYDQAVANVEALQAAVQADEAAIDIARLQVQYCSISSPLDGCIGAVQIKPGNLIKANDAGSTLVVVNQVQPIYVTFSIPQKYLADVEKYMASGKVLVEATIPGTLKSPARGGLTFVDNAINASAGTIRLRGTMVNEDRSLWPGQFVNVVLTLTSQAGAVVIPSQAVQTSQQGQYVFVVKEDMTVESRPVTLGPSVGDELVIDKGLKAGEQVVTDGQLRLTNGTHVRIVSSIGDEGERTP